MWLNEEGFKNALKTWWEGFDFSGSASFIMVDKLKALKPILRNWNRDVFGKIEVQKALALNLADFWDKEESSCSFSLEELDVRREARENYKKWALFEEMSWKQKSREVWLKEGDRDMEIFHMMANAHRRRN
ncbi:hypothetical protein PVL29_027135 [Vitis rotundifolia]|uniref:Uncharacterized protein n=1 Tax=Vitis rotundifolia TaxID=103349 RepID=A0AA38YIF4_VITRO|nr:hypothetical protein PVL29_027135 [Vitis rotundifolia]